MKIINQNVLPDDTFELEKIKSRFLKHVQKTNNCWIWTGHIEQGYGRINIGGKMIRSHRISYELFKGKIPKDLELDHLCKNRSCVNPEHLEPVTHKENVLRGNGIPSINAKKTHCKRGHEFTPENTYIDPEGGRECQTCRKELHENYEETNKIRLFQYRKNYRELNKEKKRNYDKIYNEKNKEKVKEYKRKWYLEHKK